MTKKDKRYTCPVCGYAELDCLPYPQLPPISAEIYKLKPPYSQYWGMGSYDVCDCCGFEFGSDDEGMDPVYNMSFQDYLKSWCVQQGADWFAPELRPPNWDLVAQLNAAGIPIPEEIVAKK